MLLLVLVVVLRQVAISGELSLTGTLWAVDGIDSKLQGAARAGMKKALLSPLLPTQQAPDNPPAGLEVVHVPRLFDAINHMVMGEASSKQAGGGAGGREGQAGREGNLPDGDAAGGWREWVCSAAACCRPPY